MPLLLRSVLVSPVLALPALVSLRLVKRMRNQFNTEASRVAPPPAEGLPTSVNQMSWWGRNRTWLVRVVVVLLIFGVVAVVFTVWRTDDVAVRPGTVLEVPSLIAVNGAEVYPPQNEVSLVTVLVSERLNIWQRIGLQFQSGTDIEPERTFTGDGTRSELRQRNQQRMRTSHQAAAVAALQYLGYEIPVRTSGVVVLDIASGTPAAEVLQLEDVIVAVAGTAVDSLEDLTAVLANYSPQQQVTLTVERLVELTAGAQEGLAMGTEVLSLLVELIASDTEPQRALIGVGATERVDEVILPVDITVDSGGIGGPSAGLALALGIIDLLSPQELMGGLRVAATGTISPDGVVGAIGEVDQKTIAAQRAGMDVFLVPTENLAEATEHANDSLQVVGVESLEDALRALAQV